MLERSDEFGVLRERARLALGGSPQFVVIEGPAGIGRTTLLDEFVAESTMRPLRARCDELARGLDYGVVRQLFEPLVVVPDPCLVAQSLHTLTVDAAPVLLAVDDVHVADEPSLRLLLYLARRLVDVPVLMVLTRRTGRHQVALNDLVLHAGCTVVRPRPLGVASTAAMLGVRLPAELVRSCHELTAGNPLLIRALGLSLTTWDGVFVGGPPKTAVRVLADILLTWLSELSTDAQEFAQAFAVVGDVGDLRLLAKLAGMDPVRGAAACDELWQAGFVHAEPVPRWTRPFVRETVLTGMPASRRKALHAAAARLLDEAGAPVHRVCAHLLQSPPGGDPWVVRTLCSHAAHSSPDLAATYLERALAEPPPERERAAVLVALGVAEGCARPDVAVGHLTEALGQLDDPVVLGRVVRCASDALVRAGRAGEAVELLDSSAGDLLLRAHRTVIAAGMAPHLAADVLGDVRGFEGNTVAERAALGAAAFADALLGKATADRTAELALRALPTTSSEMANPSVAHTIGALAWTDRLDVAAQRCDVAISEARRGGALFAHAVLLDSRATIAWLAGELAEAGALSRRAGDALRPEWWGALGALHHATALLIMVDSGDPAPMSEVDSPGDDFPSLYLAGARARARIAGGDLRGGLAAMLDCGDRLVRSGYENPVVVPWRIWAARACVQLGELAAARHLADEAVVHARHWGTARALGGALHALGSATRSMSLLHSGIEALESSPARLDLVHALVDLGAMEHEQGLHREARGTLRRALELAERCGARHVVTAIRQFLPRTGARRGSRPTTGLEALTESERRVAELAARWPNRRIAEELHLTLRTVETHLSATYRKLGITGRTELHDLFPEDHSSPRTA